MPPASLVWLALLCLLVPRRVGRRLGPPVGRWMAAAFLVPAVLLSTPYVSQSLLASLGPAAVLPLPEPEAIVILSADVELTAEPGVLDIGPLTLERERAGAALQRRTGLPVLVTGGIVNGPPPVGTLMGKSMPSDFGVPVQWIESRSENTWENAQFSAPILRAAGVHRVYLVTHAWHMRRSLYAFSRAGIDAVPAPVRLDPWPTRRVLDFIPRASAWQRSYFALHEWIGLFAYRWRG